MLAQFLQRSLTGVSRIGPFWASCLNVGAVGMAVIASFRDLVVWKKSIALAEGAYVLAASLPRSDQFELASQMRRSAASVPANIAEGHNGRSRRSYANHIAIALGSLAEFESHVELTVRLGLVEPSAASMLLERAGEVNRMLHALARALKSAARV